MEIFIILLCVAALVAAFGAEEGGRFPTFVAFAFLFEFAYVIVHFILKYW